VGENVDVSSALADARPAVLWLDRPDRPAVGTSLAGDATADLVVVGGGFTGLWAALRAVERRPGRDVLVVEAGRIADQATGRNGGFCSSSLTHGVENGEARFPREMATLERLAAENFAGIGSAVERYGIDCGWHVPGQLSVAVDEQLVADLRAGAELARRHGHVVDDLDGEATRAELDSPTYVAGSWQRTGEGLVDPARLAWGLAEAARAHGVRFAEDTRVVGFERDGAGVRVRTERGAIRAGGVVMATNAFRSPVRAANRRLAAVYDYVLATEPLTPEQRSSIGWRNRQGVADTTNQFHYYRLTEDDRVVWGGYDAVYHFGNRIDPRLDQRDRTHALLAEHFFETFPQLEGVRFSHRWGGVIDTCTRFAVSFGTHLEGRVAFAVGYTGLGVGASRFGADVCLDLLDDPDSERLRLEMVRRAPLPFPPEPFRWAGIQLTRRALARADRRGGRRGPWLRTLDALGLGFDS